MTTLPGAPAAKVRGGPPRASRRTRWRAAALIGVHLLVLVHVAHYQVTGRSLSPLEPSEAMQTFELGYLNAGFILLALLILSTLVLGRFFCGWACHVVAYQDLCAGLLARVGLRPRPLRSRLLIWVPLGAALYMFVWPTVDRLLEGGPAPALRWHLRSDDFWQTFPGPGMALLTFAVDGFLVVWLLGAKGFCTYGCPYGALFGLADRVAPGRIVVSDACEGCGHCTATCTSNVDVRAEVNQHGQVVNPGCMKCMDCVSVCPKSALSFSFTRPAWTRGASRAARKARRPKAPHAEARRRWDYGWGEELSLVALFLVALFAWRGLYGLVPFLLALGLAVLSAVGGLAAWRLLRSPDFAWQHHRLRAGGRWTPGGWLTLAGLTLGAGLLLHSAYVQWHTREGVRGFEATVGAAPDERRALLDRSYQQLSRARAWGLVGNHELDNYLALTEQGRGHPAEAEVHLRRAIDARPTIERYRGLYQLEAAQRDAAGAEEALRAILEREPEDAWALERLQAVQARGEADRRP